MLGYMLITLGEASGQDWRVRTAGTHAIEGSAMSSRTRTALETIEELAGHHFNAHRSHQIDDDDVAWADVIVAVQAAHVHFLRRHFAPATPKVVQLHQFVRFAALDGSLNDQLAGLAMIEPDAAFDIVDPAGADQEFYNACALELWELAQVFALLVGEETD